MAVGRQLNIKGQWRVDVPHLRMIESGVAYDFDALAGSVLSGKKPYVVNGFTITGQAIGASPSTLVLNVASGTLLHYGASEHGTILLVPADRTAETLNSSNTRIIGSFTSNATNYVGIDYLRSEDASTSDVVQFKDPSAGESPKTVPLARTLDYRIVISTLPFSGSPNICPIAVVVTDSSGNIAALSGAPNVQDARSMYFRLATGGDSPNPLNVFGWSQGRSPEVITTWTGGDKVITHEREWKQAIMSRLWEITGGEYWYSNVTDRNLKFYCPTALPFAWNGGTNTLSWSDALYIALDNSTGTVNTINAGSAVLPGDGYVAYVELNRFSNATLTPVVVTNAAYNALADPTRPGSRYIIFWRKGASVYTRLDYSPVGTGGAVASAAHTVLGVVKTSTTDTVGGGPYGIMADADGGKAVATGLTRGTASGSGTLSVGTGATDTAITLGNSSGSFTVASSTISFNNASGSLTVAGGASFTNVTGINSTVYFPASGQAILLKGTGGALGTACAVSIAAQSAISTGRIVHFYSDDNSTLKAYITKDGDGYFVGNVTAYSDLRMKENIITIPDALSKVLAMRGVNYSRKDDETHKLNLGVIAQEVEMIVPEAVHTDPDGMKSVAYGNLVGVLIEAIKGLAARVAELEKR